MKAVIAQYYKTLEKAEYRRKYLQEIWKGKIAFYVVCAKNGYFVISETQARATFPVLCFNCNSAKSNYKQCPHQK